MKTVKVNIAREMIKSREIDFANGNRKAIVSIDFIEKLMWDYHKIKVKKLTIHDVVGRSKQLKCDHKGRKTATELIEYCEDCKKILFHP